MAAASASISAETVTTAAAATTRHHPRAGASFLSFRFRPTAPARLPAAVAAFSASRCCKAKARENDDKASAPAAIDDQLGLEHCPVLHSVVTIHSGCIYDPSLSNSTSKLQNCDDLTPAAFSSVLDVAESTWDDLVLGCDSPVLVEFWAPWCGPCRLMHPVITDVAKAYTGRLRCLKLNTDENQDVATRYGIRSIPTILIFNNGERKETVIGAVTDTTLATTVERFL
ncbi:hypothetical protein U9M48_026072 [Paspalum notatum var. saurae]|uniref:Thioredoxin domain-containing protein n=1 Tax=Paspalum notatum var. saurae TaxID=547442 RepID=A0AAQ3WXZ9_PASNO